MKRIEALLSREIGLCARSIGVAAVQGAIKSRMAAAAIAELDQYARVLASDDRERRALVEEIVVSETWFFRDEEMFRALTKHVSGPWRLQHPNDKLRVLSIPCATGEEPYSVAIALLQSGLPANRFEIEAVDVSERAIETAERAVYGKNSFRGLNSPERRRYFDETPEGLRVGDAARSTVQFARSNILEHKGRFARQHFDVILCRNLLIYLERDARTRALENLQHWLAEDGVLFSGHAEALENMDPRLQRLDGATHYAYVKRLSDTRRISVQRGPNKSSTKSAPVKVSGVASLRSTGPTPSQRGTDRTPAQPLAPQKDAAASRPSLEEATQLADRGELALATTLCERFLAEIGASAEAYYLLGVVRQAAQDETRARECFDKAVYLNPSHYESLLQLALLYEKRGERTQAANYRRRAERAAPDGGAER
ncbi:MAG TPA: CheR family methyltransferase [Polyangiaceae bacterium]|nr:CheR family methyltransferase [Polyangiaceae bacterium]